MKLHSFHLMPYSDLPEDFKDKLTLYQRAVREIDRRPKAERNKAMREAAKQRRRQRQGLRRRTLRV